MCCAFDSLFVVLVFGFSVVIVPKTQTKRRHEGLRRNFCVGGLELRRCSNADTMGTV